jgi:hypothetical protein
VNPLEYAEDDEPPDGTVEVVEADVRFPNIPVPKSSNGEVSQLYPFYLSGSTLCLPRTGSFECLILLKWIQNPTIQTLTWVLNRTTTKLSKQKLFAKQV